MAPARRARGVAAGVVTAGDSRGRLFELALRPDTLPELLVVRSLKAAVRLSMMGPGVNGSDLWSIASRGCMVPGASKGLPVLTPTNECKDVFGLEKSRGIQTVNESRAALEMVPVLWGHWPWLAYGSLIGAGTEHTSAIEYSLMMERWLRRRAGVIRHRNCECFSCFFLRSLGLARARTRHRPRATLATACCVSRRGDLGTPPRRTTGALTPPHDHQHRPTG